MEGKIEEVPKQQDSFEKRSGFRVTVFGTSNDKDQRTIDISTEVARQLVKEGGFRVATGGQKHGTMKAVAEEAHRIAQELNRPDLEPVSIAMERWQPLEIGEVEVMDTLQDRLRKLIDDSEAFVSVTGGIGTFLETVSVLHGINIEKGRDVYKKPLILLDPTLKLVQMIRSIEKTYGVFVSNPELQDNIFVVNSPEQAKIVADIFYRVKNQLSVSDSERDFLKVVSIKDHLEEQVYF